jgi:hypothetical protein
METAYSVVPGLAPGMMYTTSGAQTALATAPQAAGGGGFGTQSSCATCRLNNWKNDAYGVFGPLGAWGNGMYETPVEGGYGGYGGCGGYYGRQGVHKHHGHHMYGPGGVQQGSAPAPAPSAPAMYGPGGVQQGSASSSPSSPSPAPAPAPAVPEVVPSQALASVGYGGGPDANPGLGPGGTQHMLGPGGVHSMFGPDGLQHMLGPGSLPPQVGPEAAIPHMMPKIVVGPCGIPVLAGADGVPLRDATGAVVYPPMFGPFGCWQAPVSVETECGFGSAYSCQPSVFGPMAPVSSAYM